jgi:hypothetical protein
VDHQEQHHQHHEKEREREKHHHQPPKGEPGGLRGVYPLWFTVLGVALVVLVVLVWFFSQ